MHSRLKNTQQRGRVLSGRDGPESVVEKRRNWWSRWTGIGGRDQTDSVVAMDRITHESLIYNGHYSPHGTLSPRKKALILKDAPLAVYFIGSIRVR